MHNKIIPYPSDRQLQIDLNFHRVYHPNVDMNQLDHDIHNSNKMIVHLKNENFIFSKNQTMSLIYQQELIGKCYS